LSVQAFGHNQCVPAIVAFACHHDIALTVAGRERTLRKAQDFSAGVFACRLHQLLQGYGTLLLQAAHFGYGNDFHNKLPVAKAIRPWRKAHDIPAALFALRTLLLFAGLFDELVGLVFADRACGDGALGADGGFQLGGEGGILVDGLLGLLAALRNLHIAHGNP